MCELKFQRKTLPKREGDKTIVGFPCQPGNNRKTEELFRLSLNHQSKDTMHHCVVLKENCSVDIKMAHHCDLAVRSGANCPAPV